MTHFSLDRKEEANNNLKRNLHLPQPKLKEPEVDKEILTQFDRESPTTLATSA